MASQGDKVTYFLVGGFVGAAIALLLTPRTGEETRQLIEDKYREGSEKLARTANKSKEYFEEKGDWVAEAAQISQEKLNEKSSQVMEVVGERIEQGKEVLNKKDSYSAYKVP